MRRIVILDLIENPQGEEFTGWVWICIDERWRPSFPAEARIHTNDAPASSLSLDGRGIKGEGDLSHDTGSRGGQQDIPALWILAYASMTMLAAS